MMTMALRYPSYNISISRSSTPVYGITQKRQQYTPTATMQKPEELQHHQGLRVSLSTAAAALVNAAESVSPLASAADSNNTQKDYFIPLHVDCSVEYELPNQPKPPAGQRVEPLLMIHPCYFRKMESQRRSPFINNMPILSRNSTVLLSSAALNSSPATETSFQISSSKRIAVRSNQQAQQHYHTGLNTSAHYSSIHHSLCQPHHLQPLQHSLKNTPQNISLMSQPAHYMEVPLSAANMHTLEHSSELQSESSASGNRFHQTRTSSLSHQIKNQTHQLNQVVQNSSSSTTANQWNELSTVAKIVTPTIKLHTNKLTSAPNISSQTLGKFDAIICERYSAKLNNTISLRSKTNKLKTTNYSCSTNNTNTQQRPYGVHWNTTESFMIDRGPMATVPSNLQAGPESTPTALKKNNRIISDNKSDTRKNIHSGKCRQYTITHRVHPYVKTSKSSPANEEIPFYPHISVVKAVVTENPSFQQHLRQISCFNV